MSPFIPGLLYTYYLHTTVLSLVKRISFLSSFHIAIFVVFSFHSVESSLSYWINIHSCAATLRTYEVISVAHVQLISYKADILSSYSLKLLLWTWGGRCSIEQVCSGVKYKALWTILLTAYRVTRTYLYYTSYRLSPSRGYTFLRGINWHSRVRSL